MQYVDRNGARTQHEVVKSAHVEAVPKPLACALTRGSDLHGAHHETASLPRIYAVTIDLTLRGGGRFAGVVDHPLRRLFSRPAMVMNARVHHDACGAKQLRLQQSD